MLYFLCPPAWAHEFEAIPSVDIPAEVWWTWRLEWGALLFLAFIGWGYYRLVQYARAQWGKSDAFDRKKALAFFSGLALIYIAIASPIDSIGEKYLFSVHMFQHNLFMYPVVTLILIGIPGWMLELVFKQLPWLERIFKRLVHPIPACLIFNLVFGIWHIPFLYDWALRDRMVHNLEHLTFILGALLMWMPVRNPIENLRLSFGFQMMYLGALTIAQMPVFAFVTFSRSVLYQTYELAPRLTVLTAQGDQQLGGVLMKITGMLVFSIAFIRIFMAWYQQDKESIAPLKTQPHYN
ncbi:MAG: cytochrome c oxidase assembly protein [Candidatus Sericytochromatia bacterium]